MGFRHCCWDRLLLQLWVTGSGIKSHVLGTNIQHLTELSQQICKLDTLVPECKRKTGIDRSNNLSKVTRPLDGWTGR